MRSPLSVCPAKELLHSLGAKGKPLAGARGVEVNWAGQVLATNSRRHFHRRQIQREVVRIPLV
ncbi:hypothetical protein, partial [Synechococcus sp. H65.1]|uniref:hypothetical protein n=1 Tax=unclassified Synechococcus TaxID=2626047 RepID=UPI0039C102BC